MAFSGGVFSRIHNWVTDRDNAIAIQASRMDAEMDGMATGLSTAVLKDGTQTITADLPMATYKFTGLGAGSAAGHSMRWEQTYKLAKGADVVSATDLLVLGDGQVFDVTGTTTIATIDSADATVPVGSTFILQFDGALTLTHSADLFLPSAADITTAAGDHAIFVKHAAGDCRCVAYTKADGTPVADNANPNPTTIELGHATDTTLARVSAGVVSVEGVNVVTVSSTDTLTNKTFDANGTGNSLSNVDVADLANGTDGELITWDASGAPATVGVGTAGQVLTSKGAGAAPTFTNVAAGMWARAGYSGGTPTDDASYNVTSITDTGTGDMTHNLTTALSSSSLPVLSTNMFTSGSEAHQYGVMSSTSAVRSITYESVTAQDWRRSAVVIGA